MSEIDTIHERAVLAARQFKRSEKELLDAIIDVERRRVWQWKAYPSLHAYCVNSLRLTDAQAYSFIGVARKSREVPELRTLVSNGDIPLTNARRIVPVLDQTNKKELLEKAKNLSSRELDQELVKSFPEKITRERIRPITENRLELKVLITTSLENNLKRMKDILSQKFKKAASMEEVLEFMLKECLEHHDPIRKAERNQTLVARQRENRKAMSARGRRISSLMANRRGPIPTSTSHELSLRDRQQCTFVLPSGQRCPSRRWLHRHHIVPRSQGGMHSFENLTTVCSTHHQFLHGRERLETQVITFRRTRSTVK